MKDKIISQIQNTLKILGVKSDENAIYEKICKQKLRLIWLHFSECTGCSESFIRSEIVGLDEMLFDFVDLLYHETYMSASGHLAEELLKTDKPYLLVVEGAVSEAGFYSVGAEASSAKEKLNELSKNALCVYAVGSCATYGGIQAAAPNPTKSVGVSELIENAVQIPGCPPSESNIIASILHFAFFDEPPALDENRRPAFAYAKCLHDLCERKAAFESGEFVESFGDEASKNKACLFKLGCKGPYTFNNCPRTKFNSKTSWPVQAGHGCIACSERDFWDGFGVYEKPLASAYAKSKRARDLRDLARFNKGEDVVVRDSGIFVNGELAGFLEYESKNHKDAIAKNKVGAKLVEKYENTYQINLTAQSQMANTFSGVLLAAGEILGLSEDISGLLDIANQYEFGIASGLDYKLSKSPIFMDVGKSFRLLLIYRLGGLDESAIIFGVADSIASMIAKSLAVLGLKSVDFEGEIFAHELMIDRLNHHLKQLK